MIAIIKGDIIDSRKLKDPEKWLKPLKKVLNQWGKTPKDWEIAWGDSFQLEVKDAKKALSKALIIKSVIKQVEIIDIRMAIGLGDKTFNGTKVTESNGTAFIFAGEKFDVLKKEKINLAVRSASAPFDEEINLLLKLSSLFMDNWSKSAAELAEVALLNPGATQEEMGKKLGIRQSAVSGRWKRAHLDELLEVEKRFQKKVQELKAQK